MWKNPIVWIDLEMTGLDAEKDIILEAALIVTDGTLERIHEGPHFVIRTDANRLDCMSDWCKTTFQSSGLLSQIKESQITLREAEDQFLIFLEDQKIPTGTAPLAGNSVSFDRQFLKRHMPRLHDFLHYRTLDVTSIKLIKSFWFPNFPDFVKQLNHRALDDIRESIEELKYYRTALFMYMEHMLVPFLNDVENKMAFSLEVRAPSSSIAQLKQNVEVESIVHPKRYE